MTSQANWNRMLADTINTQKIAQDMHDVVMSANGPALTRMTEFADRLMSENESLMSSSKTMAAMLASQTEPVAARVKEMFASTTSPAIEKALDTIRATTVASWSRTHEADLKAFSEQIAPVLKQQSSFAALGIQATAAGQLDRQMRELRASMLETLPWSRQAELLAGLQASVKRVQLPRLMMLVDSFEAATGSPAEPLGELYRGLRRHPRLGSALDRAIATTQSPGSFGFNQSGVQKRLEEVDHVLAEDPDAVRELRPAVDKARDATGLDDEVIVDFSEAIGLHRGLAGHEFSAIAFLASLTLGVGYFVTDFVGSSGQIPSRLLETLLLGGSSYVKIAEFINKNKPRD